MPFITNDEKPLLIGKRECNRYATKYIGYVIVRKLYLSSKTPLPCDVALNEIFGDYDIEIESIEIFENGIEGYVTFKTDLGAYNAWKYVEIDGVRIKIAYSWKQPKPKGATGTETIDESDVEIPFPFLDLCDKLICEVLDRCDNQTLVNLSETCKRLQGLLQNIHTYKRIDKELVIIIHHDKFSMSLADAHKMLKLMGKHFKTLKFSFYEETSEKCSDSIECYMHQAAKYCTNIREMFLDFWQFKSSLIEPMHSRIFHNLHKLQLRILKPQDNEDLDITLIQCPNLIELSVFYLQRIRLSKPWSSLKILDLSPFLCDKYHDEFFENCPELKQLKLWYDSDQFNELSTRLPNVNKLTIRFTKNSKSFGPLNQLSNLKNMTKLTFGMSDLKRLIEMAPVIPFLENLKELEIIDKNDNSTEGIDEIISQIIIIVRKFPNLERFKLDFSELELEHVSRLKQSLANLKSLELD